MATKIEQQLETLTKKLSAIDTSQLPDLPNPCTTTEISIPEIPEIPEVPDFKATLNSELAGLSEDAQAALDNFSFPSNIDFSSFTDGLDLASIEEGLTSLGADLLAAAGEQVASLTDSLNGVLDSLGDLDISVKNSIADAASALDDIKETLNGDGVEFPELKAKINSLTPGCLINPTAIAEVTSTATATKSSITPAVSTSIENKADEGKTPLKQPSTTTKFKEETKVFDANTKFDWYATTATFINTKGASYTFDQLKESGVDMDTVYKNFEYHGKMIRSMKSFRTFSGCRIICAWGVDLEDGADEDRRTGKTMIYQVLKNGKVDLIKTQNLAYYIGYMRFKYREKRTLIYKESSSGVTPYVSITISPDKPISFAGVQASTLWAYTGVEKYSDDYAFGPKVELYEPDGTLIDFSA